MDPGLLFATFQFTRPCPNESVITTAPQVAASVPDVSPGASMGPSPELAAESRLSDDATSAPLASAPDAAPPSLVADCLAVPHVPPTIMSETPDASTDMAFKIASEIRDTCDLLHLPSP